MYAFKDKGDRDICLIPEATAIIQQTYKETWDKAMKKPIRIFYVQKCYRYERPQAGRYREFTQFGLELLGPYKDEYKDEVVNILKECLSKFDVDTKFNESVKRGLDYYVEYGFEVEVESLGAQKQIAGGGKYETGIGWAIGLDRLLLAIKNKNMPT
jgi:histidyl-tRNA synthetase